MLSRRILVPIVFLIGAIIIIVSVDRNPSTREIDEAAWIFDSYYWDLYASGDWDNPDWRAFDHQAAHPPAAKYIVGMLLHAIGQPVTSMEPRRYWYDNDLKSLIREEQAAFFQGLSQRMTYEQVMACRYLSAAFAWFAALGVFLIARRWTGTTTGLVGFLLLIAHPGFRQVVALGTPDAFLMFLGIFTIWAASEMALAMNRWAKSVWFWGALLGFILGLSFATKIVAFANVGGVVLTLLIVGKDWRGRLSSLAMAAGACLLACGVAYLLDPGLHGSPIATTLERIAWRQDRIGIQQMTVPWFKLAHWGQRFAYAGFKIFFFGPFGAVLFVLCAAGGIAGVVGARDPMEQQGRRLALALALFFGALTIATIPLMWPRYAMAYIPFFILLAASGAEVIWGVARRWGDLPQRRRAAALLATILFIVAMFIVQNRYIPLTEALVPHPTPQEMELGSMLVRSLMHRGEDANLHRALAEYFEAQGDRRKAEWQRQQIP